MGSDKTRSWQYIQKDMDTLFWGVIMAYLDPPVQRMAGPMYPGLSVRQGQKFSSQDFLDFFASFLLQVQKNDEARFFRKNLNLESGAKMSPIFFMVLAIFQSLNHQIFAQKLHRDGVQYRKKLLSNYTEKSGFRDIIWRRSFLMDFGHFLNDWLASQPASKPASKYNQASQQVSR